MAEANPPPELGNRGYFFSWYPLPDGGWAVLPAHTPPPGSITIPPGTEPVPPPWSGAQPPLGYWGAGGGFPTNPIQLPPWAGGVQPPFPPPNVVSPPIYYPPYPSLPIWPIPPWQGPPVAGWPGVPGNWPSLPGQPPLPGGPPDAPTVLGPGLYVVQGAPAASPKVVPAAPTKK